MKSNQTNATARSAAPMPPAPSVPISVYRELATELQATRAMIDALNGKNQQLDRENQQILQEMQRLAFSLQPWIQGQPSFVPAQVSVAQPTWEEAASASAVAASLRPSDPRPDWVAEQPVLPQCDTSPEGWPDEWLLDSSDGAGDYCHGVWGWFFGDASVFANWLEVELCSCLS